MRALSGCRSTPGVRELSLHTRVAREPALALGIADRVLFAGYRQHDYVAVLHALDSLCFLVPGSDPSCRALLEAAACAVPCVTSRRAPLPEIVADGESGFVVDEDAAAMASVWQRWASQPAERERAGLAAQRWALEHAAPERAALALEALYEAALGAGGAID